MSCFHELLEENAFRMTNWRHMSDLIPFVLQEEQAQIKKEIAGVYLSYLMELHV